MFTDSSTRTPENGCAEAAIDAKAWYALYVSSRHERKILHHLQRLNIEAFLPAYMTVHRWKNRCQKQLELPLFPNYLFVHIAWCERIAVLQVAGVHSIVGYGRRPAVLPDALVIALRATLASRQVEPHPYLVIGQRVRIRKGPLAGLQGILVRKKHNLRVILTLDQIMQSAAVEISGDEVEDAGALPVRSCA